MLNRIAAIARHLKIRASKPLARLDDYEGVAFTPERRKVAGRRRADRTLVKV